jgi:hypothetical protein
LTCLLLPRFPDQTGNLISAKRKHLLDSFIPARRDHSEMKSLEKTVEKREEVLRFHMESLLPARPSKATKAERL